MVLGWRAGEVVVISRLNRSPAGEAGIKNDDVILEYRHKKCDFKTEKEFLDWMNHHERDYHVGDVIVVTVRRPEGPISFSLIADMVQGPIPVPKKQVSVPVENMTYFAHGMSYVHATGQFSPQSQVNTRSIWSIFRKTVDGSRG
jgi:hypothetical protein